MRDSVSHLKRMSTGDVIDYSIELYKRNFKKLTTLTLIFYIPFIFLFSLVISYLSADIENMTSSDKLAGGLDNLPYMFMAYYLTLLGMLLFYLVYSLTVKSVFDASVAKIVYFDAVHNKQFDIRSVIKECFKKFKPLFVNRLLYYLILLGVGIGFYICLFIIMVVVLISLGVFSVGFMTESPDPVTSVIAVAGMILFLVAQLIPLLILVSYFFAKYGMGVHSVVIENKSASEAVSRCNDISKKSFWSISLSYILGVLLFFTIPTIISAGTQSLTSFSKVLFIAANTASQIIWAFLNPYMTTLLTVIFINQKIKNEGLDLEIKVDKMIMEGSRPVIIQDTGEKDDDRT